MKRLYLLLFLILMSVSLTSAAPPFQESTTGYAVESLDIGYFKINEAFKVHIHAYNITTGLLLTNNSVSCYLHIYSAEPPYSHLVEKQMSWDSNGQEWDYSGDAHNITKSGQHAFIVWCNSTSVGGFVTGEVDASVTGKELNISKTIFYILIFISVLLIFAGLIILGLYLPSENDRDKMTGYILAVSNLKYVKIFCLAFAYLTIVFLFYYSWMISYAYLALPFIENLAKFLFYASAFAAFPFFIILIYFLIANWISDNKIAELLSRGLSVK